MQKKLLLVVTALGAMTLAACDQGKTSGIVADPLNATMIADFSKGKSDEIYASNGWSNGGGFNAVWTSDNVTYSDGKMKLSIQDKEAEADGVKYPHTAGEARTRKLYGYGDYEVRMKPTNVVGSVSTFFTYTDKWNKVDGVENKHDEIDIEFLGKDTTKVQFNYFVGGQGGHEHMHDLGFDASQGFHNYGFRWAEKSITWFVDGQPVYQVNKDNPDELPSQNGRMMASYWPSSISSWSGTYEGPSDKTCEYEWIKSSGDTIYADGEAPIPPFDNKINWDAVTKTDLEFGADPTDTGYTVTKADGVTTIAYTQPNAWKNVQAEAVDVVNANDAVSLVLKNNSTTESTVRVDVQGENKVGNRDALNEMAIAYGTDAEVSTDPEWGGSKLTLAAGEEARLVIKYDVTTNRGLAKNILIFADSLSEAPAAHQGGNITVKDIKFASTTGQPIVPPTPEPTPTVDPWEDIDPVDVTFSDTPDYTVVKEDGVTTVTYTQASNWENIIADVRSLANGENDALGLKLKNNGTTNVAIRVDVQGENKVGNTDCLNTSASASDGRNVSTDTDWGGSTLTLRAGEEIVLTVNYATDTDKGAAKNVLVYLDSHTGAPKTNNGNISISEVKFGNFDEDVPSEPTPAPVDPEPTPTPEPDDLPYDDTVVVPAISDDAVALNFWSSDATSYPAVSGDSGKSVSVTYSEIAAYAYKCIGAESLAGITDLASVNQVKVTVTNKGLKAANIRIDTKSAAGAHLQSGAAIAGEEGDYSGLDFSGEGTKFLVAAKKSVVVTIDLSGAATLGEYIFFLDSIGGDATSGKIVLSSFEFIAGEPTPAPVDPEPTPTPTPVEDLKLTFTDGAWGTYTVNPAFGTSTASVTVSYEGMEGGHYQNISAPVSPESTDNAFSVKLKNNGSATTKVRVDVLHDSTILNTSESCTGGNVIGDDIQYGGGSFVFIDADEEAVFTVYFNQSTNAANKVSFFFDSCTYEDTNSYTGNVTISEFAFEVVEESGIDWSSIDALDVTVWSGNPVYSVEKSGTVNTVTYSTASGWACCGASVTSAATDKNVMAITFTNNSEINSNIRLDLQSTIADNKNVPVTSVTSDGDASKNDNNEINFSVAAGKSITLEVTYAASEEDGNIKNLMFYIDSMQGEAVAHEGGSISISNIKFALAE